MAYKIATMYGSWPHYSNTGVSSYSTRRGVNFKLLDSQYTLRMGTGGDNPTSYIMNSYDQPFLMIYDSSNTSSSYACETLYSHYQNGKSDYCDLTNSKGRGGTTVESKYGIADHIFKRYDPHYDNVLLSQRENVGLDGFGTYSSTSSICSLGYLTMYPHTHSNTSSSFLASYEQPTSSSVCTTNKLVPQNPYATSPFFTIDLMFSPILPSAFYTQYDTLRDFIFDLHNDKYNRYSYYIGIGAKIGNSWTSSISYTRSNIWTNDYDFTHHPEYSNHVINDHVATFYNINEQPYLYGIIRSTEGSGLDPTSITPVISYAQRSGWVDFSLTTNKLNGGVKYMGLTSSNSSTYGGNTGAMQLLNNFLPSGNQFGTTQAVNVWSFFIRDSSFKNFFNNKKIILRGVKNR